MSTVNPLRVAIVGCGNISNGYAESLKTRPHLVSLLGATDVDPERAGAFVAKHGGAAYPDLAALLADANVEAVINLTSHHAHADVTAAALEAGKHVHSEKPLAATLAGGRRCLELASRTGLRLSCSPFTFLGEAQQTLLRAMSEGAIGRPLVAYSEMNWGRIENWHPNPEGFFQPGSGPLLDVGVYPLTVLTAILGPVRRVTGFAATALPDRVIGRGPNAGRHFTVTTPDHVVGGLEFTDGTLARLTASFVVRGSKQASGTELHGETGSLFLSSNHDFNARVERFDNGSGAWSPVPYVAQPFPGVEWGRAVFELAGALRTGSVQRCTGLHAFHVLETCLGILQSAAEGRPVLIESRFDPPPPVNDP